MEVIFPSWLVYIAVVIGAVSLVLLAIVGAITLYVMSSWNGPFNT